VRHAAGLCPQRAEGGAASGALPPGAPLRACEPRRGALPQARRGGCWSGALPPKAALRWEEGLGEAPGPRCAPLTPDESSKFWAGAPVER
jgi:hypothetical protein